MQSLVPEIPIKSSGKTKQNLLNLRTSQKPVWSGLIHFEFNCDGTYMYFLLSNVCSSQTLIKWKSVVHNAINLNILCTIHITGLSF